MQSLLAQSPSESLRFTERVHNFGRIHEADGTVSHTFRYTNTGKQAIEIADIKSGCGCITGTPGKKKLLPGESSTLKVSFDPAYKSGFFSKEIVVLTEGGSQYTRVWVEGNVASTEHPITDDYPYHFGQHLYMRLKVLAFGYVKPGQTVHLELHYANTGQEAMQLSFVPKPRTSGLQYTNPGRIAPGQKGKVKISYTMPMQVAADVSFELVPLINEVPCPTTLTGRILYDKPQPLPPVKAW